jgi:hypothetical protein
MILPVPTSIWESDMSKEAASADLEAAAYWRNVAGSDRSEMNVAVTNVSTLAAAARREEKEPGERPRRARSLNAR